MALSAVLAAGSAGGQTAGDRIETLQRQIDELQRQLELLKSEVASSRREMRKVKEQTVATKAPPGPIVRMSAGNRPEICSADGRNCIALHSRLHFDAGAYSYRPNTDATEPQTLHGGVNVRRARIGVLGKFMDDWNYVLTFDGGGSPGGDVGLQESSLAYTGFSPFTIHGGILTVPYTLEETTSSNNLMFIERASPVNIATSLGGSDRAAFGVSVNGPQWWAGAFVTGPTVGAGSGQSRRSQGAVTGRAVVLPVLNDHASLLIGGDVLHLFTPPDFSADDATGTVRLRDRMELRIDPARVLDTGNIFDIDSATVLSAELAGGIGSFYFQGEYFHYNINRHSAPDLTFDGGYIQASYVLTGESRRYSPGSGVYGGITPSRPFEWGTGNWGAWEIAARYSYIDLNDEDVFGGKQQNFTLGLNWYVNRNMRFMFNYIHGKVDKFTADGLDVGARYDAFGMRTQIAF